MQPEQIRGHTRFIVGCVTLLGMACVLCGTFLIYKGFQSGELLLSGGAVGAISGLLGFLGGKAMGTIQAAAILQQHPTPPAT